ncbi:MAG: hypothetical protein P8H88_04205 [Flavobacteriales bacterium]|jgi:hypothetical protein|nr:hypothetical protein [Flavobacteriales bacterium]
MSFPEAQLCTGLPADEARRLARETVEHSGWVQDLIRIASDPEGGTAPRKAAWVLRHAALCDASALAGQGLALLRAVDESQDASVHRELLKTLLELPQAELNALGEELHELGLGLCADTSLPVAMVHVGVQLIHASGLPWNEEVADVWRERGARAETVPLARFLSKQLQAIEKRRP